MEHPTNNPPLPELEQQVPVDDRTEREPGSPVHVYVASLADYNYGRLHGAWLDAAVEVDELAEGIQTMLAHSPIPDAEEWAIHDYEGFGPLRLSEYENLDIVSQIGRGIAEHGAAFAHWAALCGTSDPEDLARFDDVYLGHWDSIEAYADDLLDELGIDAIIEQAVPDHLQAYVKVDVEGFARDLEYSGEVNASEGDNGVYLFDQTR